MTVVMLKLVLGSGVVVWLPPAPLVLSLADVWRDEALPQLQKQRNRQDFRWHNRFKELHFAARGQGSILRPSD